MNKTYYFVTGGCGFIGSYVIQELLKIEDIEIINIDKMGPGSSRSNVSDNERVTNFYMDINEPAVLTLI